MRRSWKRLRLLLPISLTAGSIAIALTSAPNALAAACPPPPTTVHPFSPWGDFNSYVPVTDGGFEPVAKGSLSQPWSLSQSGSSIVSANEPWHIDGSSTDGHALSIQAGGQATSACTTAPLVTSIVRFFVRNTGSASGELHVQLLVNGGRNGTLDGGYVTAGSSWQPTTILNIPWSSPLAGAVNLQVVLTPVGAGASFQIDDVYLDPCKVKLG